MKNILEEFRMERQYDFMKKYKITKVKYEVVMKRIYEDEKLISGFTENFKLRESNIKRKVILSCHFKF